MGNLFNEDGSISNIYKERYHMNKVNKERLLFMAFCSEYDKELLMKKNEMKVDDFERILYLLYAFGFDDYSYQFSMENQDMLEMIRTKIEAECEHDENISYKELEKSIQWSKDFVEKIESVNVRECISKIFCLCP